MMGMAFPLSQRQPRYRWVLEALCLVLLPPLAVQLLKIQLLDQEGYIDPEYYTGYGLSFVHLWHGFGLNYYAARYPVLALNMATQWTWPGLGGYLIARSLVFALAAMPLYLLARREWGRAAAMAGYAFLIVNPLFPRVISWDLTTFVSIPAGLAGIALWLLATTPLSVTAVLAGFLFWVSTNSHVFTATAVGVFLGVDFVFAVRSRAALGTFAGKTACSILGAAICCGLGVLFYLTTVGYVSPLELWRITAVAIKNGNAYMVEHHVPFATYAATNYEIYAPAMTTVALAGLLGSQLLADTVAARIAWFAFTYVAFYAYAVFVRHMGLLVEFSYFHHLTIATYLAVPAIVAAVTKRAGRSVPLAFMLPMTVLALWIGADFARLERWSLHATGELLVPIVLALLTAGTVLLMRSRDAAVAGIAIFGVLLQVPLLSASYRSVFDRAGNLPERPLFDTIREYQAALKKYDRPKFRVLTWYPSPYQARDPLEKRRNGASASIVASNLNFTLHATFDGPGMPVMDASTRDNLANGETRYVLLLDDNRARLGQGLAAISAEGFSYSVLERYEWGYPPLQTTAVIIRLNK